MTSRALPLAVLAAALLLAPPLGAGEGEVRVEVDDDGTVRMTRVVAVSPERLLRVLSSRELSADLSPDVISKELLADGECPRYRVHSKGLTRPLVYDYSSCLTADGLREDLVASEDFDAFAVRWHLRPVQGGTEIGYHLLVKPRLRVPQALVRMGTKRSMKATLNALVERASGP